MGQSAKWERAGQAGVASRTDRLCFPWAQHGPRFVVVIVVCLFVLSPENKTHVLSREPSGCGSKIIRPSLEAQSREGRSVNPCAPRTRGNFPGVQAGSWKALRQLSLRPVRFLLLLLGNWRIYLPAIYLFLSSPQTLMTMCQANEHC